jgi:alginate O-acetyltransferase complex protein AlgI
MRPSRTFALGSTARLGHKPRRARRRSRECRGKQGRANDGRGRQRLMLFQTPLFFAFFAVVMSLYAATMQRLRLQNAIVMVASYIFYAVWDLRFLSLIITATAVAFVVGQGASGERISGRQLRNALVFLAIGCLASFVPGLPGTGGYLAACAGLGLAIAAFAAAVNRMETPARARASVWAGIVFNLGLLAFFKYFNFFADSLADLTALAGVDLGQVTLKVVLPVGISFFTFQKLAYIVDIRRGRVAAETDIIKFGAFVAYFPQLVAGPIERAGHLLRQFDVPRQLSFDGFASGAALFLWGMYKKVVIADNISPLANRAFDNPAAMTSGELLVGLLAFTFQIFCDFSGYSDMARGLARIMGLDLMINFNIPYVARTPSDFWERWHISLSSWLRDYLYIPLGGNRGGALFTYRNLFLTMLLGGLWHGASWTFVAWGAFHGSILIVYRLAGVDKWLVRQPQHGPAAALRDGGLIAVMFLLTMFGWLLFRAPDVGTVAAYLAGLAEGRAWTAGDWGTLGFCLAPLLAVQAYQLWSRDLEFLPRLPGFARLNVVLFFVFSLLFLAPVAPSAFIYFDF